MCCMAASAALQPPSRKHAVRVVTACTLSCTVCVLRTMIEARPLSADLCPPSAAQTAHLLGDDAHAKLSAGAPLRSPPSWRKCAELLCLRLQGDATAALAQLSVAAVRLCAATVASIDCIGAHMGTRDSKLLPPHLHRGQLPPYLWLGLLVRHLALVHAVAAHGVFEEAHLAHDLAFHHLLAVAVITSCIASQMPAPIPWLKGSTLMLSPSSSSLHGNLRIRVLLLELRAALSSRSRVWSSRRPFSHITWLSRSTSTFCSTSSASLVPSASSSE
mmetsp:Transcript_110163/g.351091  ORF Transcript_110163/g.351091 Transcript_110163/m.351091 type:complete len:274 (-) Transcript_110163:34-855(-)